jgi:hypothetical protein
MNSRNPHWSVSIFVRMKKRAAMLELDPLTLEGGLLEIPHLALKKNKHPLLAVY